METEHEFTLILDGVSDLDDKAVDALYEAGCDDSTIMTRAGRVMIGFIRSAPSREDAVLSAINDIERAKVCTGVKELEPRATGPDDVPDDFTSAVNSVLATRHALITHPKLAILLQTASAR